MKLDEIPSSMLAKAVEIYLDVAYRGAEVPSRILEISRMDPSAPLRVALARDWVEKRTLPDRPNVVAKYRWRLGNGRYPHMKLGIERCSEADDFVFVVDTHDRDFPVGTPGFNDPEFHDLLRCNSSLKQAIESRWQDAGIPTFGGHISQRLHGQCHLTRGQPKTVLVVDDDPSICELERALLEEAGYRVVTASDGPEALAILDSGVPIELCSLDIMMPPMDGVEVARRMRSERRARFPIVFVTALSREHACEGVADGYVGKPFDPDYLLDVIRRQIG